MKATRIQSGNRKWTVSFCDGAPVIESTGKNGNFVVSRLTPAQARQLAKALTEAAKLSNKKGNRS